MSTNYPTSIDSLTNPSTDSYEDEVSHAAQHSNANDAIEALQTKVGIDSSADVDSLDYKVANITSLLDALYPVGSIYMNAAVATNPGTLFGFGTWVAAGVGKVIVGMDSTQVEFDTLGETGGNMVADLAHTHTNTQHTHAGASHTHATGNASNDHSHTVGGVTGVTEVVADNDRSYNFDNPSTPAHRHGFNVTSSGQNTTHTHNDTGGASATTTGNASAVTMDSKLSATQSLLQPYEVAYVWKRTA